MGQKTKIDWADSTWNPVTGCLHGCEYCYARRIAERFDGKQDYVQTIKAEYHYPELGEAVVVNGKRCAYPYGFSPTFHRYKLDEPQKWRNPKNIFVCSMADLFGEWVPDEWIDDVFRACEAAPQHRYIFLTKNPERYIRLRKSGMLPKQHWYGTSVTRRTDRDFFDHGDYNTFISIEPIMESFARDGVGAYRQFIQPWVIIGAETGNRRYKVIPKKKWITELVDYYSQFGYTKFFMKESLREIMGDDFRQEFPWEAT